MADAASLRIAFAIARGARANDAAYIAARAAVVAGHQVVLLADGWEGLSSDLMGLPAAAVRVHHCETSDGWRQGAGFDYVVAAPGNTPWADFWPYTRRLAAGARLVVLNTGVTVQPGDSRVRAVLACGALILSPTRAAVAQARLIFPDGVGLRHDIWPPYGEFPIVARRIDELLWRSLEAIPTIESTPVRGEPTLPAIAVPAAPVGFPLAYRSAGDGWSAGEEWGQWSVGDAAWLAIELPRGTIIADRIEIGVRAAASPGGSHVQQGVVIQPSRGAPTRLDLPRDVVFRDYRVIIPREAFAAGKTILEFRIDDPAPVYRGAEIIDRRALGVAISSLWLA